MGLLNRTRRSEVRLPPDQQPVLVVVVGDSESSEVVSERLLNHLITDTNDRAQGALNHLFGYDWCAGVKAFGSLTGPTVGFHLDLNLRSGTDVALVTARINGEYQDRWAGAVDRLM